MVLIVDQCAYSHDSLGDLWVTAHAEVVVAAPHRHVSLGMKRFWVVVSHGEWGGTSVHCFKNPVRVIHLLAVNLLLKELVILEGDSWWRKKWEEIQNVLQIILRFIIHLKNMAFLPLGKLSFRRWDTLEDMGFRGFFWDFVLTLSASIRSTTDKSKFFPVQKRCALFRILHQSYVMHFKYH